MFSERRPDGVVDLLGPARTGPLWGMASTELNTTLLAWPPGYEVVEDIPTALDVLLIVLEGGGTAHVEDREHELGCGTALLVERGSWAIRAGDDWLRYLSVHRRRGPLQVAGMTERPGS